VPFGSMADPVSQLAFLLAPQLLPALKGLRASGEMPRGSVLANQRGSTGDWSKPYDHEATRRFIEQAEKKLQGLRQSRAPQPPVSPSGPAPDTLRDVTIARGGKGGPRSGAPLALRSPAERASFAAHERAEYQRLIDWQRRGWPMEAEDLALLDEYRQKFGALDTAPGEMPRGSMLANQRGAVGGGGGTEGSQGPMPNLRELGMMGEPGGRSATDAAKEMLKARGLWPPPQSPGTLPGPESPEFLARLRSKLRARGFLAPREQEALDLADFRAALEAYQGEKYGFASQPSTLEDRLIDQRAALLRQQGRSPAEEARLRELTQWIETRSPRAKEAAEWRELMGHEPGAYDADGRQDW
jgi:hypothetical protein